MNFITPEGKVKCASMVLYGVNQIPYYFHFALILFLYERLFVKRIIIFRFEMVYFPFIFILIEFQDLYDSAIKPKCYTLLT